MSVAVRKWSAFWMGCNGVEARKNKRPDSLQDA